MAKKNSPLKDIFEDFAHIFSGKPREEKFDVAENLALLDANLQKIARGLKEQTQKRRDDVAAGKRADTGVIFLVADGIVVPKGTLNAETIEKMAGYKQLHDICRSENVKLDVQLQDSLYDYYYCGTFEKAAKNFASGFIIADTALPYSESKLEINLAKPLKPSNGGPKPE